jgi:hypothetical protein
MNYSWHLVRRKLLSRSEFTRVWYVLDICMALAAKIYYS